MGYNFDWGAATFSATPVTSADLAEAIIAEKAAMTAPAPSAPWVIVTQADIEADRAVAVWNASIEAAITKTAEAAFAAAWTDLKAGRPGNTTLLNARLVLGAENNSDWPDTADKATVAVRKRAAKPDDSSDKGHYGGWFHD